MALSFTRVAIASLGALVLVTPRAEARPYVTVYDDGTIQTFSSTITMEQVSSTIMGLYDATGASRPDVISVWTAFDVGGEPYGTFFLPQANPVKGIGFDGILSPSGLLQGTYGPVNAILLHNSVLALTTRAQHSRANPDATGFAQYLFLLEFSHQWLAAARVPGTNSHDLGNWPHWSFWFNSGDSPAGGNNWMDNGDGTFSTVPVDPAQVKYSNLDLYLMGLVDAGAVGTFDVLENAVAPATPTDPDFGGKYAAHSLRYFAATPLTVTATSKSYTMSDIIEANGVRDPATSQHNYTLGIVLMVAQNATADEVTSAQAVFDPISETLVPAFQRATGGIATLTIITDGGVEPTDGGSDAGSDGGSADAGEVDAGVDAGLADSGIQDGGVISDAGSSGDAGTTPLSTGGCSCGSGMDTPLAAALLAAVFVLRRRRLVSQPSRSRR